jgi:hypothetical protein
MFSFRLVSTPLVLVWIVLCAASKQHMAHASNGKQLVLFAGPHKAAGTSVEEFFYTWASGHNHNGHDKSQFALRYWRWPRIYGMVANQTEEEHPYKIFGHLVTEPTNEVLKMEILEGIRDTWEIANTGIILGTEEFDRVGPEETKLDGLAAMRSVVGHLSVPADDVVVILNYRTPRFDQWVSLWKHATGDGTTYEEYLCNPEHYAARIEALATQLNPLNAALIYLEQGWKVHLVDMGGVEAAGRDVSHVIACDILNGKCDEGDLRFHTDEKPHKNALDEKEFVGLSEEEMILSEQLLRFRDCAMEKALRKQPNFQVVMNDTVWADCTPVFDHIYQSLNGDTSIIYKALLSQVECPEDTPNEMKDMLTMDQVMNGEIPEIEEFVKSGGGGFGLFTEAILMPLIILGALGYQVYHMFTSAPNSRPKDHGAAVSEAEMGEVPVEYRDDVGDPDADKADHEDFVNA